MFITVTCADADDQERLVNVDHVKAVEADGKYHSTLHFVDDTAMKVHTSFDYMRTVILNSQKGGR